MRYIFHVEDFFFSFFVHSIVARGSFFFIFVLSFVSNQSVIVSYNYGYGRRDFSYREGVLYTGIVYTFSRA